MNGVAEHLNLDRLAAQRAQQVIERTKGQKHTDVDNTATKALGVLQENGIYACALYLLSRRIKMRPNGPRSCSTRC